VIYKQPGTELRELVGHDPVRPHACPTRALPRSRIISGALNEFSLRRFRISLAVRGVSSQKPNLIAASGPYIHR
jgi:hypothetical protein